MEQGPIIRRRTAVGGPPSDLPEQPLLYPGTPLTRRFIPATQTRKFEEANSDDENKVAKSSPFTPVVSIGFADKSVHIGPVVNEYPRSLTPVALSGRLLLPARGAGIFELPDDIRRPLEARIGRLTTGMGKPAASTATSTGTKTTPTQPVESAEAPQASVETANLNTELEKLREVARQELSKRQGRGQLQEALPAVVTNLPTAPQESPTQETVTEIISEVPTAETTEKISPKPEDETQKLLSEAEKLEAELSKLQSVIPTTEPAPETKEPLPPIPILQHPPPSVPAVPGPTKDEHLDQIDQLTTEKNELSAQAAELRSSKEEGASHISQLNAEINELSNKLAQISSSDEERLNRVRQLEAEKNTLSAKFAELESAYQEEIQKKQGLENQIKTLTQDFDRQSTQMTIEKTNLFDEVQKLRKGAAEASQSLEENEKELSRLNSELTTTQTQRDTAKEQVKNIDSLLRELGSKTKEYGKTPVRPEEAEEPTEEQTKVKVVKPQLAVGKMAPALTNTPNVINGIVKDPQGLLLSDVIIVVKDSGGQPVRALKSNKIGQFAISTPLPNGTYTMELESPGHSFDIVEVDVEGKVMHPIQIQAGGGN
ncbi:MAG: hypothetical protein A2Z42_00210 [Candidatus Woykebacteria bacterium RBG_19FT_COMBO_43_10]|uniref:Carboxypeptidase regulatory-like domain-containing protein n=1 Tax=Candidatus Woykebacteria bacterium RBG_19FT_COMBO_43_10 TaxID=1802598 RepID=A0A1G1WIN7_9BACT|nr:MAG: hypothetical protein A2Z42_00210 [Candidatus Woykebacteria bacterium RBG_19FT_COMBO_43_10]